MELFMYDEWKNLIDIVPHSSKESFKHGSLPNDLEEELKVWLVEFCNSISSEKSLADYQEYFDRFKEFINRFKGNKNKTPAYPEEFISAIYILTYKLHELHKVSQKDVASYLDFKPTQYKEKWKITPISDFKMKAITYMDCGLFRDYDSKVVVDYLSNYISKNSVDYIYTFTNDITIPVSIENPNRKASSKDFSNKQIVYQFDDYISAEVLLQYILFSNARRIRTGINVQDKDENDLYIVDKAINELLQSLTSITCDEWILLKGYENNKVFPEKYIKVKDIDRIKSVREDIEIWYKSYCQYLKYLDAWSVYKETGEVVAEDEYDVFNINNIFSKPGYEVLKELNNRLKSKGISDEEYQSTQDKLNREFININLKNTKEESDRLYRRVIDEINIDMLRSDTFMDLESFGDCFKYQIYNPSSYLFTLDNCTLCAAYILFKNYMKLKNSKSKGSIVTKDEVRDLLKKDILLSFIERCRNIGFSIVLEQSNEDTVIDRLFANISSDSKKQALVYFDGDVMSQSLLEKIKNKRGNFTIVIKSTNDEVDCELTVGKHD